MHSALQEFHKTGKQLHSATEMEQLLARHREKRHYADEREEATYFAKGKAALQNYAEASAGHTEQTLGTEVFMSHIVNLRGLQIRLGCKADSVCLQPDGVLACLLSGVREHTATSLA
ncbi:MAG: hypothetical protein M3R15_22070 [Acidobacteriota bacterium]|nr:hypothetical protein [Acidobacteriota bacterium]